MIVNFQTQFGRVQMHGEAAIALLRLMGHSGSVPGAILAAELPSALEALERGLARDGDAVVPTPPPRESDADDEDTDAPRPDAIRLRTRAVPLIDLMSRAVATKSDLMWDRA